MRYIHRVWTLLLLLLLFDLLALSLSNDCCSFFCSPLNVFNQNYFPYVIFNYFDIICDKCVCLRVSEQSCISLHYKSAYLLREYTFTLIMTSSFFLFCHHRRYSCCHHQPVYSCILLSNGCAIYLFQSSFLKWIVYINKLAATQLAFNTEAIRMHSSFGFFFFNICIVFSNSLIFCLFFLFSRLHNIFIWIDKKTAQKHTYIYNTKSWNTFKSINARCGRSFSFFISIKRN